VFAFGKKTVWGTVLRVGRYKRKSHPSHQEKRQAQACLFLRNRKYGT